MRERAAYWYRNVVEQELLQGRSIEGFAAAAVYVAARERHYPVTIDGLAEFCPGSAQDIRHHMSVLNSEFSVTIQPAEPKDFLPSIISKLPVAQTVEYRTNQLIESVMENGYHVGKHPAAIAATAVYAVANDGEEDIKQETVAAVADISKVTVSRHHQKISEILS